MRRRRKSWTWLWLVGAVIVGAMFTAPVKDLVRKIPYVGNMIFPTDSKTV